MKICERLILFWEAVTEGYKIVNVLRSEQVHFVSALRGRESTRRSLQCNSKETDNPIREVSAPVATSPIFTAETVDPVANHIL